MQKPMHPTFATPRSAFSHPMPASTTRAATSRSRAIASFIASSGSVETLPS